MRCPRRIISFVLGACCAFASLVTEGQEAPRPDLVVLLDKTGFAKESQRVPFRLRGAFRLNLEPPNPAVGSFDLIWVSPDKWRQEVKYGDYYEVRYGGSQGKYWQAGRDMLTPGIIGAAISLFRSATFIDVDATKPGFEKVVSDLKLACFSARRNTSLCLDPAKGELRYQLQDKKRAELEFTNYAWFGVFAVPSILREKSGSTKKIEAWVENMWKLETTDEVLFTPPPEARVNVDCEKPQPPRPVLTPDPEYPSRRNYGQVNVVVLRTEVGVDGKPRYTLVERSGGADFDREAIRAVNRWRFKPALCQGQPIPMTINIEVNFNLAP